MNSKTVDPIIDARSGCKKLIKFTDSLLRGEIDGGVWANAISKDLYILRLFAKAYALSVDLEDEQRLAAVIMYIFSHCGVSELGIRVLKHIGSGVLILFYSKILDIREKLCPDTEVYTVLTHDGNLITRTNHGDEIVDLDPICIHATAVNKRAYVPNKFEFEDLYEIVREDDSSA